MDSTDFNQLAEDTIKVIGDALEKADTDYQLEVDLIDSTLQIESDSGMFIINKHEASQQIWLSSPISGASHFSYDDEDDVWLTSDGNDLYELLIEEFKEIADLDLAF